MQIKRYGLAVLCSCILAAFLFSGCGKKEDKKQGISQLEDLNSPRYAIGCMTGVAATDKAKKAFPKANFLEYSMPIDGFTALTAGKLDAMVLDRPTLEYMAIAHPELTVMPQDLAVGSISVAVAKNNEKRLRKINEFIRQYRADGTYAEMFRRWFRTKDSDMPEIPSPQKVKGTLKVGVTANNEPLCFLKNRDVSDGGKSPKHPGDRSSEDGDAPRFMQTLLRFFQSVFGKEGEKGVIRPSNADFAGFDAEFSLRLGAFLGKKVEFFDMPYDALVMALESGRIDVAVAYMDTIPEREESVSFSENYIDAPISVIVHKNLLKSKNFSGISKLSDLDATDCSIAVMTEIFATREAKRLMPNAEYLDFPNVSDCYVALSSGKVHAIIYDRPALEYAANFRPEFMVLPENLASGHISVGANLGKKELMRKVDEFIDSLRKDGTRQQMYDRWIKSVNPVMPEIGKPRNTGEYLVIGIDTANPPLCYIKDGKPFGYDVEFSERLALYLNKQIKYVILPFDGILSALKSGKIDLAIAQMDATPERKESALFSKDYIDGSVAAMILKKNYSGSCYASLAELKGKRIGTLTGSAYEDLAKGHLPEYKPISFSQLNQAIAALENRKIDALFIDRPIARFVRNQRPKLAEIPEKIPCGDTAFLFPKREKEFCNAFSSELRALKKNGTLKKLQDKWFDGKDDKKVLPEITGTGAAITFCTVPECQPFSYVADGKITGYEIEIAILIANKLNRKLNLTRSDFSSLVENVQSGKADFAGCCIIITKERQETMLFSESDYDGGIVLLTLKKHVPVNSGGVVQWFKNGVRSLGKSFEKTFIREMRWKLILQGLATTLVITVFAVLLGTVLAFPICMMSRSHRKIPAFLAGRYVSLFMGTPILVILMILYYVIFAKVDISGVFVAILAFALDFAAYTSVTLRSGIDGIPRGQMEAALALGHTPFAAFMRFVLPQAVRTVLPVYRGEIISTLKSTSIVGYIAIMDLTKMGDIIRSRTYEAFFPLIAIALIYFLTAKGLSAILLILEHRLDPDIRRARMQKRGAK